MPKTAKIAVVLAAALIVAATTRASEAPLFTEDFETMPNTPWGTLPAEWWFEGEAAGARARIEEGRLLVDANGPGGPGATVWLDRDLPANVEVSFDVHVVASRNNANNMNLLFQFRDPQVASLRETRAERADGRYPRYHSDRLQGTLLTFVGAGESERARFRLRQVPPFDPVVQEHYGHHSRVGHTYHVSVARRGDRFTCVVDEQTVLDTVLPAQSGRKPGGFLGFRTFNTKVWWDNLMIRRLASPPRTQP